MLSRNPSAVSRFGITALAFVLVLAGLEAVLSRAPVAQRAPQLDPLPSDPIRRFHPHRRWTWSRDWDFSVANVVSSNNAGFITNIPYRELDRRSLTAIVGDSFVEALQVPWSVTCGATVARAVAPRRVYTFGTSSSALPDYLAYAKYARDRYGADSFVFVVITNDFEAVAELDDRPGYHQFVRAPSGNLEVAFRPLGRPDLSFGRAGKAVWTRLVPFLHRSALVRYLALNLRLYANPPLWSRWRDHRDAAYWHRLAHLGPEATRRFLQLLPVYTGVAPRRILLVVDRGRAGVYSPDSPLPFPAGHLRAQAAYFVDTARAVGFTVADLRPAYLDEYSRTGLRFEFERDWHWNARGHAVCARAVTPWVAALDRWAP